MAAPRTSQPTSVGTGDPLELIQIAEGVFVPTAALRAFTLTGFLQDLLATDTGALFTVDDSSPLSCISAGDVDVDATTAIDVAPDRWTTVNGVQVPGRVMVMVQHVGSTGYIRVAFGVTASATRGRQLAPGHGTEVYTADRVSVYAESDGAVAVEEWGA